MISQRIRIGSTVALVAFLCTVGVLASTSLSDYERVLNSIPVSNLAYILSSVELGMTQPDFPDSSLLRLMDRLADRPGGASEKEAILLIIAHALEDGLPAAGLVNKALEGLARGVPLPLIEQDLEERLELLAETRDLLYSKGIFSVPAGVPQTVPTAIPVIRFNQLLINISETIGDFLEGGGSPFDGNKLTQEVQNRLIMLQGVTLLPADVELVLGRIQPSDLTQVALAAVS